jgi:hypothetical protein
MRTGEKSSEEEGVSAAALSSSGRPIPMTASGVPWCESPSAVCVSSGAAAGSVKLQMTPSWLLLGSAASLQYSPVVVDLSSEAWPGCTGVGSDRFSGW